MKTFKQYISEKHSETYEEGFLKNAALGAMLAAGAYNLGANKLVDKYIPDSVKDSFNFDDEGISGVERNYKKLKIAADKAGIPRKDQNNLTGHSIGGIVVSVNGRNVPLTSKEIEHVRWTKNLSKSMGN